ncbi:hypothetical protein ACFZDK_01450 [Streptomyces sp. NPDC007901]|uniref:hypothetical protein n=1 Tax=Streptomyces sp. NPDC007901 TaxID=3364785 RepID=UPI0036E5A06D
MSVWAYVVIAAACVGALLLDLRGVRIYRALRVRGVSVKARCVGIEKDKSGQYVIKLNFTNVQDGRVYQFKEANYKTPPLEIGEESDALYDPAGYAPASLVSRHTLKRAFPYLSCVALPLLAAATLAFASGF